MSPDNVVPEASGMKRKQRNEALPQQLRELENRRSKVIVIYNIVVAAAAAARIASLPQAVESRAGAASGNAALGSRPRLRRLRGKEERALDDTAVSMSMNATQQGGSETIALAKEANNSPIAVMALGEASSSALMKEVAFEAEQEHGSFGVLGSYPVTTSLLWIVHLLYFVQWKRNRRRRKIPKRTLLTYKVLVERKQFYKWWLVLFSQYRPAAPSAELVQARSSSLSVPMGHPISEQEDEPASSRRRRRCPEYGRRLVDAAVRSVRDGVPASWRDTPAAHHIMQQHTVNNATTRGIVGNGCAAAASWWESAVGVRYRLGSARNFVLDVYFAAGGRSLLLLLYNSHLVWSARALEGLYAAAESNSLSYLRLWISVGIWATLLELGISHFLLQVLAGVTSTALPTTPTTTSAASASAGVNLSAVGEEGVFDGATVRRLRDDIRHRAMGTSLTVMSAALLMIFRFKFSHVAVPVVPWFPVTHWIGPNLAYLLSLVILYYSSLSSDSVSSVVVYRAMASGSLVGWLWGSAWLDFCASSYWGNGVLLMALLLTGLSLKAKHPDSIYLAWLDRVGCDERGRMLVYDSHLNRWAEDEGAHLETTDVTDDDETEDSNEDLSEDDDSERAFPTIDDQEIYGRATVEMPEIITRRASSDHDDATELMPSSMTQANQVRSRRGGSVPVFAERGGSR